MKKIIVLIVAAMAAFSAEAAQLLNSSEASQTAEAVTSKRNRNKEKAKKNISEITFKVHLHCANCVKKVEENIAFEKGVKDLHVTTNSIQIKYDAAKTSEAALKAAIEKLGYKILDEAHDHHHHSHN
jgi:copper chaperone CopZ